MKPKWHAWTYALFLLLKVNAQDKNSAIREVSGSEVPNFETTEAEDPTTPSGLQEPSLRLDIQGPYNESVCKDIICIVKCCPENKMLVGIECVPASKVAKEWNIEVYEVEGGFLEEEYVLMEGLPKNLEGCVIPKKSQVVIQANGFLYSNVHKASISPGHYCLDAIDQADDKPLTPQAVVCDNSSSEPKISTLISDISSYVVIVFQAFSILCLTIVILLHVPILKNHHLQDNSFLCFCLSQLVLYLLSLLIITPGIYWGAHSPSCTFIGFALQYVGLSFNLWLAIRCYDVYRIMKGSSKAIPLANLVRSKSRFVKYCFISYGIPLVITSFTILAQFLPVNFKSFPRPNIGFGTCWIEAYLPSLIIYYFTYQFALHALSMIFMVLSAHVLYKNEVSFQCCGKPINRHDGPVLVAFNKPSLDMFREQFYLFLITVVIMSLDSVSVIGIHHDFWRIVDILNALQGVFILVIVMRSPPRRKLLVNSMKKLRDVIHGLSTRCKSKPTSTGRQLEDFDENSAEASNQSSCSNATEESETL